MPKPIFRSVFIVLFLALHSFQSYGENECAVILQTATETREEKLNKLLENPLFEGYRHYPEQSILDLILYWGTSRVPGDDQRFLASFEFLDKLVRMGPAEKSVVDRTFLARLSANFVSVFVNPERRGYAPYRAVYKAVAISYLKDRTKSFEMRRESLGILIEIEKFDLFSNADDYLGYFSPHEVDLIFTEVQSNPGTSFGRGILEVMKRSTR